MQALQPPKNRQLGMGLDTARLQISCNKAHQGLKSAMQALQFSDWELTNSQYINLKKTCYNEIQVSQMILLMEFLKGQCYALRAGNNPTLIKVP